MNKSKFIASAVAIVAVAAIVVGFACIRFKDIIFGDNDVTHSGEVAKVDDWKFEGAGNEKGGWWVTPSIGMGGIAMDSATSINSAVSMESANIGFSVGGSKDINKFRENIGEGYFPISTDITYNGLFYDYSFDTGMRNESTKLFSPSYSTAISKDPVSSEKEYYMTVGLNSNIKESDFERKKLNLVVVLDISGSMSSGLSSYYYDDPFEMKKDDEDSNKSKMELANESVNILIDQLKDDDRFGMVLFDDVAYLGKELSLIRETDVDATKEHILKIKDNGGTNFEAGYKKGTELFDDYLDIDSNEYENRIIVITDAMPNYGNLSRDGLLGMVEENAENGIYTTFIGVGVDFNTDLVETISDVRGANYYSVHSAKDFKERMGEQFEYMVTPLVFDLELKLKSDAYEIEAVYGSDTVNKKKGEIMKVNTLFPSKTNDNGEVKGGVVLLKLKKKSDAKDGEIVLSVSYKDRSGVEDGDSQRIVFNDSDDEYFENNGIRKAILLTRYANVLKNWILYERSEEPRFVIVPAIGIPECNYTEEEIYIMLGEYERRSVPLTVSDEYKEIFANLKTYFEAEVEAINDEDLEKEIEVLELLLTVK